MYFRPGLGSCFFAVVDGDEWPRYGGIGVVPSPHVVRQLVTWNGLLSPSVSENAWRRLSCIASLPPTFFLRALLVSLPTSSMLYLLAAGMSAKVS